MLNLPPRFSQHSLVVSDAQCRLASLLCCQFAKTARELMTSIDITFVYQTELLGVEGLLKIK